MLTRKERIKADIAYPEGSDERQEAIFKMELKDIMHLIIPKLPVEISEDAYMAYLQSGGKLCAVDYVVNIAGPLAKAATVNTIKKEVNKELNLQDDYYADAQYKCEVDTTDGTVEEELVSLVHDGDLLKTPHSEITHQDVFGNDIYSEYVCAYHGELLGYW